MGAVVSEEVAELRTWGAHERGQAMMPLARRASLLVVFCLLMSAATAYAECAWVLWARYAKPPYTEWTSWSSVNYWETKSRCWRKITDLTSVPEEGSFADWWLGHSEKVSMNRRIKDSEGAEV
jgi:hypothetical protein